MDIRKVQDFFQASVTPSYPQLKDEDVLVVSVPDQRMYVFRNGSYVQQFLISTAAKGSGNISGSEQTPLGLHEVKEKHGEGVPLGGILSSRKYTGVLAKITQDPDSRDKDWITSRILWLSGLEPGINLGGDRDTFQRYIYIHGTAEEGRLGTPVSHGCVRMGNADIIQLYDRTAVGTKVLILNHGITS